MSYSDSSVGTERRQYYSSSQGPFYNANNIYMFYGGGDRGTIVDTIIRSLRIDDDLIHVHGESGSGKTMLSLVLADRLKQHHNIIRYDIADLTQSLLLRHLLIELCPQNADLISAESAADGISPSICSTALHRVCEQLRKTSPTGKPYVLIVDSQAAISAEVMQLLETLSAIRCDGKVAAHCIVFRTIAEEDARAISVHGSINQPDNHYWLRRLTLSEINEYLRHHMMLFDFNRRDLFSREMAYFIADRSEGVLRSINTLARNAFMIASLENEEKLSMSHLLLAGLRPRTESAPATGFFWQVSRQIDCIIRILCCSLYRSVCICSLICR